MSAQENMPPPTLKRARPHSTNLSSSSVTPTAGVQPATSSALPGAHTTSRAKRRKPEPANVEKEREKEGENEIKTKVSGVALEATRETALHIFFLSLLLPFVLTYEN